MKILKGDKVKVLIGKDKGRDGEVLRVLPQARQIVVKGINLFKKHVKSTKTQKGGIIEKERPILVSKIMLICPSCQKTARVSYKIDKAGSKSRHCSRCQAVITTKVASSK